MGLIDSSHVNDFDFYIVDFYIDKCPSTNKYIVPNE